MDDQFFVRTTYFSRCEARWRCAGLAIAASAQATDFVGVVQPAALAQPMINIALSTSDSGPLLTSTTLDFDLATGQIVEKTIFNLQAYFDTGASGVLLSTSTASDFGVPLQTVGATQVTYQDVGAVGSATFNVSQPIFLRLSPTNPAIDPENPANYSQLPGSLRAQVGPVFDAQGDDLQRLINELLGGDINVVGTPAMAGNVVVVDLRATNTLAKNSPSLDPVLNSIISGLLSGDPTLTAAAVTQLNQLEDGLTLRSYLYAPGTPFHNATPDTDPGIPATNRHIKLTLASFDRFISVSPPGHCLRTCRQIHSSDPIQFPRSTARSFPATPRREDRLRRPCHGRKLSARHRRRGLDDFHKSSCPIARPIPHQRRWHPLSRNFRSRQSGINRNSDRRSIPAHHRWHR